MEKNVCSFKGVSKSFTTFADATVVTVPRTLFLMQLKQCRQIGTISLGFCFLPKNVKITLCYHSITVTVNTDVLHANCEPVVQIASAV